MRKKDQEERYDHHNGDEGKRSPCRIHILLTKDRHGREDVAPERRRRRTDGGLKGDDDAYEDVVQTGSRDRRLKDRRQDHDDDDGVHEHAPEEVRERQNEQDADRGRFGSQQRREDHVGNPAKRNRPREGLSHGDEDEDNRRDDSGPESDFRKVGELDGAIDQVLHQKRIEDRNRGGLRGAEFPGVDPAEDDDGEGKAQ